MTKFAHASRHILYESRRCRSNTSCSLPLPGDTGLGMLCRQPAVQIARSLAASSLRMLDELGMGDVMDRAAQHNPRRGRILATYYPLAGIPTLMKDSRVADPHAVSDVGQGVTHHRAHRQTAHGLADLGADSALDRAEHLQQFTQTSLKGMTRVPATWTEAQDTRATADPEAMLPLMEGSR